MPFVGVWLFSQVEANGHTIMGFLHFTIAVVWGLAQFVDSYSHFLKFGLHIFVHRCHLSGKVLSGIS
jgi:hypothetical protein